MSAAVPFKDRLVPGRTGIGCWLQMFNSIAAEVVAQAGYDCVLIDLEHGPGWYLDMIPLIHAIQGQPCAPLVRVPSNDPVALKKVLDIGVAGVMVPSVDTAEQAAAAVAACRYPPKGHRGMAVGIVRASDYGARTQEYLAESEDALMIMCQIESAEAVENVREIAAVEGVDMLFIGPFDLSASLGHLGEPDHPKARAAIDEIEAAAKSAGVMLGTIPTPGRSAADLAQAGYSLVMADSDLLLLRDAARSSIAAKRPGAG